MSKSRLAPPKRLIGACAAAVVISAFLPWFGGSGFSVSGIRGDGEITFVIGLVGLAALASNAGMTDGVRLGERPFATISLVCALGATVIGVVDWNAFATIGLYLTLIAGIAWIAATIWALQVTFDKRRDRRRRGERTGGFYSRLRTRRAMSNPPEPFDRRPRRLRGFLFGWLGPMLVAAVAFLVLGLVAWMNSGLTGVPRVAGWIAWVAIIVLASLVGSRLHRYGSRLRAHDAAEALRRDRRPPVVFLRSFADDETRFHASWKRGRTAAYARTYEETLTSILQPLGPVIAIGDPADRLRDLGAARMYLDQDDWQEDVLDLLAEAQLVIVHAAESEGVLWEVARVVERIPPERILLSLPRARMYGIDRERYASFRKATSTIFPRPLPEELAEAELMYFDDDWTPRLLTKREYSARRRAPLDDSPRERALYALAPTFEDNPFWYRYRIIVLAVFAIGALWATNELLSNR